MVKYAVNNRQEFEISQIISAFLAVCKSKFQNILTNIAKKRA